MTHTKAFIPERYLQKLVTVHTYIECLIRYAHLPRLRRHFYNKKFAVETVRQPCVTVVMPKARDWERVVADALQFPNLFDNSNPKVVRLFKTLKSNSRYLGTVRAPIHCECALITHYQNRPNSLSVVPPLEYIGVSKLSCKACALFFEASNKASSSRFYTRGSHQKWYFPWAMPKCKPEISDEFALHLSNYLGRALEHKGIPRRRHSDSSAGTIKTDNENEEDQSVDENFDSIMALYS